MDAPAAAVEVRLVTDAAGAAVWAAVKNAVAPHEPVAAAEVLREVEHDPEGAWHLAFVDGEAAGCGLVRRSQGPGLAYVMVRVVAARRGRGVGTALFAAASEHARRLGLDRVRTRAVEDDGPTLRFLAHRGFEEVGRECEVRLDLTAPPAGGEPRLPEGVRIVSLASRLDLVPEAYALEVASIGEVAGAEELDPPDLAEWRRENVDEALVDGSRLALAGPRVVGYAGLIARQAEPGVAEHLLTAVTREWRRRGIAHALKVAEIDWARRHGFHELVAHNNGENEPMRALNARLGYTARPAQIVFRGPAAS